jgi:hypothetical protein
MRLDHPDLACLDADGVPAAGRRRSGWHQGPHGREGVPMTEDPGPDPQPPKDDVRWLIYLAVGFVVVLALLLLSGLQSSHIGH